MGVKDIPKVPTAKTGIFAKREGELAVYAQTNRNVNTGRLIVDSWPKLDPITGRKICRACWNNVHNKHDAYGRIVHACDGECDCVHRSEETWAAIERQKQKQNRSELRKNLKEQLEDPDNPLLAINDSFKPKKKGKAHA